LAKGEKRKGKEKNVISNETNPDNEDRAFYNTLTYEEALIAEIINR